MSSINDYHGLSKAEVKEVNNKTKYNHNSDSTYVKGTAITGVCGRLTAQKWPKYCAE